MLGDMRAVLSLLVLAACGGAARPSPPSATSPSNEAHRPAAATTTPSCEEVVDHIMATSEVPADRHADDRAARLDDCETTAWSEAIRRCLLAAPDESSGLVCHLAGQVIHGDVVTVLPPELEAAFNLDVIASGAREHFDVHGSFPISATPLTPTTSCCSFADGLCPADGSLWTAAPWADLRFWILDAHRLRYSYQSDGTRFVATATGDGDCDGVVVTYALEGHIANGVLTLSGTSPRHED